jgi:hypothetical protein
MEIKIGNLVYNIIIIDKKEKVGVTHLPTFINILEKDKLFYLN